MGGTGRKTTRMVVERFVCIDGGGKDKYDLDVVTEFVKKVVVTEEVNMQVSCYAVYVYGVTRAEEERIRREYPLTHYSLLRRRDGLVNLGIPYNLRGGER